MVIRARFCGNHRVYDHTTCGHRVVGGRIGQVAVPAGARAVALSLSLLVMAGCTAATNGAGPSTIQSPLTAPGTSFTSPVPTPSGPAPSSGSTDGATPSVQASGLLPNPGAVERGSYTLVTLDPSPVITLGEGWWAGWDYGDSVSMPDGIVALENELSDGFVRLAFWDTTDLEIQGRVRSDVRTYIRKLSKVANLTERQVVIGGRDATRFDFRWTGEFTDLIFIPQAGFVLADDEPQHWVVLDTAEDQLLINWTVEEASGKKAEAEAEVLVGRVLRSLHF